MRQIYSALAMATLLLAGCASANTRLETAIKDNSWENLKQALEAGADVNHNGKGSLKYAIHVAIDSNDANKLDYLLQKKPSTQQLSIGLGYAAVKGKPEAMKKLISAGAPPDVALQSAAGMTGNYMEIVEFALASGAKVSTDPEKCEELKAAIWKEREDLALRLVELGAMPDTLYHKHKDTQITNFCEASRRGMGRLVEAMLKKNPRLDVYCEGHRPLGWARKRNDQNLIKILTRAKAPEDARVQNQSEALPTEATDNNCEVTFVASNSPAPGRSLCSLIKKVNGLYVALDSPCAARDTDRKMGAKILAACALGGQKKHFLQMGLRLAEKNEFR